MKPVLLPLCLSLSVAMLVASCNGTSGGDGDSNNNGSSSGGDGQTATLADIEEFLRSQDSGVWRSVSEFDLEIAPRSDWARASPRRMELRGRRLAMQIIEIENETLSTTSCDLNQLPVQQVFDEQGLEEFENQFCPGGNSDLRYFINGNNFGLEMKCDGAVIQSFLFGKLYSGNEFNSGSYSFSSDQFDDVSTAMGVCGGLEDNFSRTTDLPGGQADIVSDTWSFNIVGPYGADHKLRLLAELSGNPGTGDYTVTTDRDLLDSATGQHAFINFTSNAFGTGSFLFAQSGTVTVSSVSDFDVTGTYDIITQNTGDRIVGSFSLDLNY